jgi:hypothetical protein
MSPGLSHFQRCHELVEDVTEGPGFFSCLACGCGPNFLQYAVLFCNLITFQPVLLYFPLNEENPRTKWQRKILIWKLKPNNFLVKIVASQMSVQHSMHILNRCMALTSSDCWVAFESHTQARNQLQLSWMQVALHTFSFNTNIKKSSFYLIYVY